ncbi:MAG TPA: dihydropteroate synthase [Chloroflexota bacterium]
MADRCWARVLAVQHAGDLQHQLLQWGAPPEAAVEVASRAVGRALRIDGLDPARQGALARAADALRLPVAVLPQPEERATASVVVAGSHADLLRLAALLEPSEGALSAALQEGLQRFAAPAPAPLRCGQRLFAWGARTYVMGVINVTPDSFSGDGVGLDLDAAVAQGERFAAEGADILDVGGESTRPGASPVTAEEEARRVVPVVRELARRVDVPISVDTMKAEVARQALEAGAVMVNDVWGLRHDPEMARVVAEAGAAVVLMHNRTAPPRLTPLGGHYPNVPYRDLLGEIVLWLAESIDLALAAGVAWDRIVVDPGIGFGKGREQNLEILRRLGELRALGRPILLGTSRKSFIGLTLNLPVDQRVEGTAATIALGIANGADVVRVHDVREMVRVARMTDAVVRERTAQTERAS